MKGIRLLHTYRHDVTARQLKAVYQYTGLLLLVPDSAFHAALGDTVLDLD